MSASLKMLALGAAACWGTVASAQVYEPPAHVSLDTIVSTIEEFMRRPDMPLAGSPRAYVEDIVRINAVELDWDILDVGFGDLDGRWVVSVFGRNLLEARPSYNAEFDKFPDGLASTGGIGPSSFTTYGVKFTYSLR